MVKGNADRGGRLEIFFFSLFFFLFLVITFFSLWWNVAWKRKREGRWTQSPIRVVMEG